MTKMGGFHKINSPVQSVAKYSPTPYETGDIFSLGVVGYVCFPYVADFHPPPGQPLENCKRSQFRVTISSFIHVSSLPWWNEQFVVINKLINHD